ncbi:MAG: hypothetical protein U0T72_10600 [Chitinophagales bacterium]
MKITSSPFYWLVSLLLTFHCLGVTQLAAAYSIDKDAFIVMLNMAEEETHKETDNSQSSSSEYEHKNGIAQHYCDEGGFIYQFVTRNERVVHQFISEQTSPPPNFIS